MITEEEMQSLLAKGKTFKMTKNIPRYKTWHFGNLWKDAEIGQHPVDVNRTSQVRMFVRNWRVLGFPDMKTFVKEYNDGKWEII